jgi:hypothetical protein
MNKSLLSVFAIAAAAVLSIGCSADAGEGDDDNETGIDDAALTSCSEKTEVWLWHPSSPVSPITEHLTANKPCTHYYVGIALVADSKTNFHPNVAAEVERVHKLGSNFHAVAEFHYGAWHEWIAASPGTRDWRKAGLEFRRRMDAGGFDIHKGDSDTWLVQEFPSTLRSSAETRDQAAALVKGLYDGGARRKLGAVTHSGVGQAKMENHAGHKAIAKEFLTDESFWRSMGLHVRWWLEQVYADPHATCVASANVATQARAINDYTMYLPRLASKGPASAGAARSFFDRTYTPLLNGSWNSDVGYGDTRVTSAQLSALLSMQIYATRTWSETHAAPDHRFGFAWVPQPANAAQEAQVPALGKRTADAINGAYKEGTGTASRACSPSGAYTFCQCNVAGAKFNTGWHDTYETW